MTTDSASKEKSKNTLTRVIGLIGALLIGVIAFVITLVCSDDTETGSKILLALGVFVCATAFANAICYLVFAILQKNRFYGIFSYFSAAIGLVFLLIVLAVEWYFVLLAAVLVFLLFWLVGIALYSNKLAIVADNEKPDFKTYEQRKAEKTEAASDEEEVLPEIKSFKD